MAKALVNLDATDIVTAAGKGNIETVKEILECYPAQVDIELAGITALQNAARGGHLEIVKLLAATANIDFCDSDFRTPLHYAVNANKPDSVDLLLKLGAKMEEEDINGDTPPQIAFKNKYKHCVKHFLDRDRNVILNRNYETNTSSDIADIAEPRKGSNTSAHTEDAQESTETKCFNCNDRPAIMTFEPCGCRVACFLCAFGQPACSCGDAIQKVCLEDDGVTRKFMNEIKCMQEKMTNLENRDICKICHTNRIDCTLECGHLFCHKCVRRFKHHRRNDEHQVIWKCCNCSSASRYTKVFLPWLQ